jgi:hypothetical protein
MEVSAASGVPEPERDDLLFTVADRLLNLSVVQSQRLSLRFHPDARKRDEAAETLTGWAAAAMKMYPKTKAALLHISKADGERGELPQTTLIKHLPAWIAQVECETDPDDLQGFLRSIERAVRTEAQRCAQQSSVQPLDEIDEAPCADDPADVLAKDESYRDLLALVEQEASPRQCELIALLDEGFEIGEAAQKIRMERPSAYEQRRRVRKKLEKAGRRL